MSGGDQRQPKQKKEVADRAQRWLGAGTHLVWGLSGRRAKQLLSRTPDAPMSTLRGSERLDGLDVLPGFMLALTEVFA